MLKGIPEGVLMLCAVERGLDLGEDVKMVLASHGVYPHWGVLTRPESPDLTQLQLHACTQQHPPEPPSPNYCTSPWGLMG